MALPSFDPPPGGVPPSTRGSPVSGGAALYGAVLVAFSSIAFSAKAVIAKLMYERGIDPMATLALRMAFAAPAYLAVAIWTSRGAPRLSGRDVAGIVLLGTAGYYASSALDFIGLKYISAGLERLILFTYPTVVVLLSAVVLRERIRRYQAAALVVTYAGIALVFEVELDLNGEHVWLGSGLVFACSLLYASYLVGSTRYIRRLGSERFTALALLVSTGAVLAHFGLSSETVLGHPPAVYGLGFLMAVVATVLPTFALAEGIRRLGPGPSAILGTIGPVSTLFLAHWFLGEPILPIQLAGTALVLVGATAVAWRVH